LHGGRWNSVGARVIYAAETYAGEPLEILAHSNLSQPPKNHRVVRIEIPPGVKIESVVQEEVPGWDAEDAAASRTYGDEWIRSKRTAVLRVPSVITQGREYNLVLNSEHPDFKRIQPGAPEIVHWDARLFQR
jgi:RES domain-containing protein